MSDANDLSEQVECIYLLLGELVKVGHSAVALLQRQVDAMENPMAALENLDLDEVAKVTGDMAEAVHRRQHDPPRPKPSGA